MASLHWESWLLRLGLLGTVAFQIATSNKDGATVAAEGCVVSLLPLLIGRLSKTHVPRPLEFAFVLGMALQFFSESTKLFELFYYWDKIVHPTLIALSAMIAAWLILGFAHAFAKHIPIQFGAVFGLALGMTIGALWEFIEFTTDHFSNADLQKSNGDTMTDIMANDVGAFVATLIGLWIFTHHLSDNQRREMGQIARWLGHGPRLLLERHGRIVGTVVAIWFAAMLFLWGWVDRNPPALASGLQPGQSRHWNFVADPLGGSQVLAGDWVPDAQRGVCRQNLENPKPGSEKMGLLELTPDSVYGQGQQPYSVQIRYFEERPAISRGSEMDAGIAFGIRDDKNFDLLEENALHDVLRLDHFIHSNRRDLREKLYRTHGNEWHLLRVDVSGATVTAIIDEQPIYSVANVPETAGGIGLWARAAAATCFSEAQVTIGG